MLTYPTLLYTLLFAPLLGAACAGIYGYRIGNTASHYITIAGLGLSFAAALMLFCRIVLHAEPTYHAIFYTWGISQNFSFPVGFLIDPLAAVMLVTVTFVSLLVHIYSIGYMRGDTGYARFFAYMSLFTFFMLILVSADNFLVLFFGWEGVGLVSYLLIGFWFQRESAVQGSLKAFLVNRVGDMGFILGIATLFAYFGALDYATVFHHIPLVADKTLALFAHTAVSIPTLVCLLLFIGAMAKSAQVPLHVWLPESMEGPTPISALIHAATMVTAGVYMVARMSPLFIHSQVALSVVLVVGATGALFLGIVAVVQHDIKRVIAYSTLSQLGYMMAANGVSAFSASIFHLVTHAGFKALLFLAAGSVIIALHHEQDMRKMGGLRKYMPITYITFLIGALALAAIPPFSGFYSKDAIIEMVQASSTPGASYAYVCLLLGAFVTALYIFRAFFLSFHGTPRFDAHSTHTVHESPLSVTLPLILLAIPSLLAGAFLVYPMLSSNMTHLPSATTSHYTSPMGLIREAFTHLPVWFSLLGILVAWLCYLPYKKLPSWFAHTFAWFYLLLRHKYGFDHVNNLVFVHTARKLSQFFFQVADVKLIDGWLVNGSGRGIAYVSAWARKLQTGYLYHYALTMVLGLFVFLLWLLFL